MERVGAVMVRQAADERNVCLGVVPWGVVRHHEKLEHRVGQLCARGAHRTPLYHKHRHRTVRAALCCPCAACAPSARRPLTDTYWPNDDHHAPEHDRSSGRRRSTMRDHQVDELSAAPSQLRPTLPHGSRANLEPNHVHAALLLPRVSL
jgi:hypothetical protein